MTGLVEAGGAKVRVRESGSPGDDPIVMLHGIGRSLEDWVLQHELLPSTHRVISMDLLGFGLSEPPPGPMTLSRLAAGVHDALDALDVQRPVHVFGNSLGGAVALAMQAARPERVSSVVLAAPAGFGQEVALDLRLLAIPGLGHMLLRHVSRAAARRTERALYHDGSFVTEERIEHAMRVGAQPGRPALFLDIVRELGTVRGIRPGWRSALLADVARHPRPTLIVWGDRDRILPAHHLPAARKALPHAQSHVFADTGHLPQVEAAAGFGALVGPFLKASKSQHVVRVLDTEYQPITEHGDGSGLTRQADRSPEEEEARGAARHRGVTSRHDG
jgi:2-hydroxymuconate-semialdehyde hydrolase